MLQMGDSLTVHSGVLLYLSVGAVGDVFRILLILLTSIDLIPSLFGSSRKGGPTWLEDVHSICISAPLHLPFSICTLEVSPGCTAPLFLHVLYCIAVHSGMLPFCGPVGVVCRILLILLTFID